MAEDNRDQLTITHRALWGVAAFILLVLIIICVQTPWVWSDENTNPVTTEEGYKLANEGELTVAATFDWAPFVYRDGLSVNGFAHELLSMLASDMNLNLKYYSARKESRLSPIIAQEGYADIGIVQSITEETDIDGLNNTDPYLQISQCVIVMKSSNIQSSTELDGKRVGIVENSPMKDWVEKNLPNAQVTTYETLNDALSDMRTYNLEGIVGDYEAANYETRIKYGNERIIEVYPGTQHYNFVVSTENPVLGAKVNAFLAAIKEDGRYDELYSKWFTGDNEVVPDKTARKPVSNGDARF